MRSAIVHCLFLWVMDNNKKNFAKSNHQHNAPLSKAQYACTTEPPSTYYIKHATKKSTTLHTTQGKAFIENNPIMAKLSKAVD